MTKHKAVLKKEAIDLLQPKSNSVYVDVTLGAGGHCIELLNRITSSRVIAFDLDSENLRNFEKALGETTSSQHKHKIFSDFTIETNTVKLINDNFENIKESLSDIGIQKVDGVIADLGWSSDQLSRIPGLSFSEEEDDLDMRLDKERATTAADLLNGLGKSELKKLFERYSDIFGSDNRRIVEEIYNYRKRSKIEKVSDLKLILENIFSEAQQKEKRIVSRVFQALRIAVNMEYESLKKLLNDSWDLLNEGGVLSIISFHSGEENIIREFLKTNREAEVISKSHEQIYIRPSVKELTENLRARSAKLWGIKK